MGVVRSGKSVFKAAKLLKVSVEFDDCIRSIRISGDFFLHPEEKITALEAALVGVKVDESLLRARAEDFFAREKVEVFGFSSEDLAKAVISACTPVVV